ncbi:MAG: lysophospholipid acyltransferase family protein [Devosia sp.]
MAVIQALRTALFYLLFLGQTVILAIIVGTAAMIRRGRTDFGWRVAQYWAAANLTLLRRIVGISTEVSGIENLPPGPCIIAGKHMSDWDIFALLPHTSGKPAFMAKKELMDIPFFGQAAASFDTIMVDRKAGAEGIPRMMADARKALAKGCRIIIFPEGTRKAPLADPDYRQGIVRMYRELNVPVVPVALDSGLYWGRNSLVAWPGTARAKFLPAIQPGLTDAAFRALLIETVERETRALVLDAIDRGIARPVTGDLAERARAARQAAAG